MSEPAKGPVKSVRTDKFVMPLIPEELHIDPRTLAILHSVSFLELSGDETVDPDWAVEAMEHMAYYLKRLSPDDLSRVNIEMQTIASWAESHHLSPHFTDLVRNFLEYVGLNDLSSE
jgi:hypothetical protein